jgi:2'-5' RNA ligase
LVPDEGYSNIIKLHDKLYSGSFQDYQRLDIDFVPHIGIANSKDKFRCKQMVEEWNEKDFSIKGTISHLTIATYDQERITHLKKIELRPKKNSF